MKNNIIFPIKNDCFDEILRQNNRIQMLPARWTFEAAQDAQAMQGIDVEAEIMAALAQQIIAEYDYDFPEPRDLVCMRVLLFAKQIMSEDHRWI